MQRAGRFASLAAFLLSLLVFAQLSGTPFSALAIGIATVGSSAVLGALLIRRLVPDERSVLCQLVFGAVVVLTLSRILLMLMGIVVRFDVAAYGIVAAGVVASIAGLRGPGRLRLALTAFEAALARQILWLSAALFTAMALAFVGVGVPTPNGFAFPSYFNHDFLHHGSVVSELTRGMPPTNPYMVGAPLHYYWFYHLWPAMVAATVHVTALQAMTSTAPFVALVFVAALMMTVSHRDPRARSLAVAVSLFAPSLLGLLAVFGMVLPALRFLIWERVFGAPPVVGLPAFSFISHSWFRDSLYELHALTALSMAMTVFYLGRSARERTGAAAAIAQGMLLGMTFMTDAVIALVVTAFFGLRSLLRLWREPGARRATVILGLAFVGTVLLAIAIGALPVRGGLLTIGLSRVALIAPFYLAIEVGPLALLAVIGFLLSRRSEATPERSAWLALTGVCLFSMFMVLAPGEQNFVFRKTVKVLQLPLVVFAAPACAYLLQTPARRVLAGVLLLVGGLTIVTDIRHYLHPKTEYVSYITASEMQTMNWLRRCTAPDVVVQDLAAVQPADKYMDTFYSVIAAIGERRTLWGNMLHPYLFRADAAAIDARRRAVEAIGVAPTPEALHAALSQLKMDLLYVDQTRRGPVGAVSMLTSTGFLNKVYCSAEVCLYAFKNHRVPSRCEDAVSGQGVDADGSATRPARQDG